jgi:DNA repair ATPase RecN
MAIQSTEDNPDSLTRIWSVESRMRSIYIESTKPLITPDALSDAILWARSPEFEVGRFSRLAKLTPQELEKITPKLEEIDETARKLSYDLNQIASRRSRGLDAEDILEKSGFHSDVG